MNPIKLNLVLMVLIVATLFIKSTKPYKYYNVEHPDVCSEISKKRLKLGSGTKSAIYLNHTRLNVHPIDWRVNFICKFEIKVESSNRKKDGIFAVIQTIVFRKNETSGECIDYVQFKTNTGETSQKFCGRSNAALTMDSLFSDDYGIRSNGITSNSFIDPNGELDVYIFVDKESLKQDEETDLQIAFTTFKSCARSSSSDKPCDDNHHRDICIHAGYFNDGIFNCPYYNCVDEGGCHQTMAKTPSVGNKVLIGSVTSLLLMFGIFVCCIYICRKYGKLCWADEFANATVVTIPMGADSLPPNETPPGSAPTIVDQLALESMMPATAPPDKDLPPSYDSLFPTTR